MSIFQDALNTIKSDLKLLSENTISAILHTDLSPADYSNNKGKFQAIGFTFNLVNAVIDWIEQNPNADSIPSSFLSNNPSTINDNSGAPEVHTIAIDSSEGR